MSNRINIMTLLFTVKKNINSSSYMLHQSLNSPGIKPVFICTSITEEMTRTLNTQQSLQTSRILFDSSTSNFSDIYQKCSWFIGFYFCKKKKRNMLISRCFAFLSLWLLYADAAFLVEYGDMWYNVDVPRRGLQVE